MSNDPRHHEPRPASELEEVLLGRVVDGEATPADWAELERLAGTDQAVWTRLASAQRAHARLIRAVEDRVAVAELIDLPRHDVLARIGAGGAGTGGRARQWGGWAAAAAVALVWASTSGVFRQSFPGGGMNRAGVGIGLAPVAAEPPMSTDDYYSRFMRSGLAEGRILGEMPARLVESRDLPTGDREITYVRQIVERRRVTDAPVLGVSKDEAGVTRLVPVGDSPTPASARPL
ncbi:MAG: hypothetical protein IBJ11_08690 [Phycisphaerales bacterium]|nr:hypothetical protein [Phycisphaerales bacterium]